MLDWAREKQSSRGNQVWQRAEIGEVWVKRTNLMPEEPTQCKHDKLASSLSLSISPPSELIFILSLPLSHCLFSLHLHFCSFPYLSSQYPCLSPPLISSLRFNQSPWFLRYVLAQQPLDSGRGYRCRDVNGEGGGVYVYSDIPFSFFIYFVLIIKESWTDFCFLCSVIGKHSSVSRRWHNHTDNNFVFQQDFPRKALRAGRALRW